MSNLDGLQPRLDYCQRDGELSSVEMYPSSAVAQTYVPGSAAHIGTLQQPPSSSNASSYPPHCSSTIVQNPTFDSKHNAYRSAEVSFSVSVNKVSHPSYTAQPQQQHPYPHQQPNSTTSASAMETTVTSTNTATSAAMMIDDPVAASVDGGKVSTTQGQTSNNGNSDKDAEVGKQQQQQQQQQPPPPPVKEAGSEQTDGTGSNSAVRTVR
ncbi:hypothetical protein EX895_004920 [Sporisorium graminicola]|uniref:Uncharacterized protein n=1 Tax=Sporisorium graminicola TaxID=280036 RepID=A0A4U7KNP1_9BASI|nr:hypothetical protein EX895_004920 [Sporisorium graminicola]TKY86095.1 hypothetical protein EX895_004920 [Sporisorium graminicola]